MMISSGKKDIFDVDFLENVPETELLIVLKLLSLWNTCLFKPKNIKQSYSSSMVIKYISNLTRKREPQ